MNCVSDSIWRVPSRRSTTHNGPRIECRYFMTSFALEDDTSRAFHRMPRQESSGKTHYAPALAPKKRSHLLWTQSRIRSYTREKHRFSSGLDNPCSLASPCGEASQFGNCGFRQLRLFGRHPSNRELFLASDGLLLVKSQAVTTPLAAPFGHFAIQRESQHLAHTEAGCQHDREPAHNEPLMRVGHKFVE